ncbi:MAG TPA: adenylate/guanylate cyclase domain-containing protein [Chitinophagaceae bacterium]
MPGNFDYTATARKFWRKFPVLTYLSIQVNFWMIANLLLGAIMHLQALRINQIVQMPGLSRLKPIIIVAIIFGILYGIILGLAGYYLEKTFYRKKSLGKIIVLNTVLSLAVLVLLLTFVRFILVDLLMTSYVEEYPLSNKSWEYFFVILVIYYFFMTLLINFINQVNKKYGPGVLVPLLLGKYRRPREEERIFMFMDLKSSTTLAEKLGHLRYSSFIRDSFMDINNVVSSYDAEIYQYAGDEMVLSWRMADGISNASCIRFYFACRQEFFKRTSYYQDHYGILPEFKAGVHGGIVTAVEIGNIKRDIAYHGDVLNTAARIQGLCNEYDQQLLVSTTLLKKIDLAGALRAETLGHVILKGKKEVVEIAGINNKL